MAKQEKNNTTSLVPIANEKKGNKRQKGKRLKLIAAQIAIPNDRLKSLGTKVNGKISISVEDQVITNLAPDVDIIERQQPRTIEFADETFEII